MKIHNFDKYWSITSITNSSGSAMGTYEYDPYGILLSSSSNLGNFAFTGQEIDFETNLYHFPARYYEPYWGRFLTADPWTGMPDDERNFGHQMYIMRTPYYYRAIGKFLLTSLTPFDPAQQISLYTNRRQFYPLTRNPQALSVYLYVNSNPINHVDPYGLFSQAMGLCATIAGCIEKYCKESWHRGESAYKKEKEHDAACEQEKWDYFKACVDAVGMGEDPPPLKPGYLPCEGYLMQFDVN